MHNASTAEDLVQETLLAALKARQQFAGRSSESTWLIGILKNKIMDHLRKAFREQATDLSTGLEDNIESEYFNSTGHWRSMPSIWNHPEQAMEQTEFMKIFQECINGIPARQAEIFKFCELDGMSAKETSKVLDITTTNIWVALHRARLKLRDCIDKLWFNKAAQEQ